MEDPRNYEIIHINTYLDRQSTDLIPSKVTTYLSEYINGGEKMLTVELIDVQLPMLSYTFPEHSSVFWLVYVMEYITNPTEYRLEYEILPSTRNFNTGQELAAYLNSRCDEPTMHASRLKVTFDAESSKLLVQSNVPLSYTNHRVMICPSYRYDLSFTQTIPLPGGNVGRTAPASDAMDRLGFTQNMFTTTTDFSKWMAPQQMDRAESPIRLLRSSCYYNTLDEISANTSNHRVPSPYKNPKILAKIPAKPFGQLSEVYWEEPYTRSIIGQSQLSTLTFNLLDDELEGVQLERNSNICMTLKIGYL